jgi:GT2 family glycosyltransferase
VPYRKVNERMDMSKSPGPLAMTSRPIVSVVIPTFGRLQRLQGLLRQLVTQDAGDYQYEIIVVDDGSPEPVANAVEAVQAETDIPIRCFRQANGGPALARNYGAKEAGGDYLLFCDDDMLVPANFIMGHIETQLEHGPAGVMCSFDWLLDMKPESLRAWYERRIAEWNGCLPRDVRTVTDREVYEVPDGLITTATLSIHRSDFERLGGFDSNYRTGGCEDQDFGRRLVLNGVRTLITHKTKTTHAESRSSFRQLCLKTKLGAADTVRLVRRFAHLYSETPAIAHVNGPAHFGTDPLVLIAKKAVKRLLVCWWVAPVAYRLVSVLERVAPKSRMLCKTYDLLSGASLQQGWREGLVTHQTVESVLGKSAMPSWSADLTYG